MKQTDVISYEKFGFDGEKYIKTQKDAILERISKFSGRLYLEIGGKFLSDSHASRVLPGFLVDSKKEIFASLKDTTDIIFCLNSMDLSKNRQLSSEDIDYDFYCKSMILNIEKELLIKPKICINRVSEKNIEKAKVFKKELKSLGFEVYFRYEISNYPKNTDFVLSKNGYGKDDYIQVEKDLVLVTGAASSSGKMSTCLGQIYLEKNLGLESGYAKYETFPIWNLDLNHPINLAYEAATADIGDYNILDSYHKKAYNKNSVNYNRDVEAFEIVSLLAKNFLPKDNFTRSYKSPTDMGINMAGFCITDDDIVKKASLEEIERRKKWYKEMIDRGEGDEIWIERCEKLEKRGNEV